jgi:hypothetical protein
LILSVLLHLVSIPPAATAWCSDFFATALAAWDPAVCRCCLLLPLLPLLLLLLLLQQQLLLTSHLVSSWNCCTVGWHCRNATCTTGSELCTMQVGLAVL